MSDASAQDPAARRPTLADVARLAGLSKTAVSLILNDRPGSRLSQDAIARVRAAAAELDYRPNPAAQSLRLGKTRSIGFISDEVTITRHASAMIRGVLGIAREHDHTVLIAETTGREGALGDAMTTLLDRRVDGIVVGLMAARLVDVPAAPHKVPVVIVNGRTPSDLPSVLPDERTAGHAMPSVLIEAGHRRIGILGELPTIAADPRQSVSIGIRFEGIHHALREAGITPVTAVVDDWDPSTGYREAKAMMSAHPELTALIAGNDSMAFGIYQALAELGLRVPDDVSVVSFDDEELGTYLRPGLTTARLPYEEMARRGVGMLLGGRDLAHDLVPMPVIRRASVRALL
ncbi:MAG: LacI family DNA-binding transcriptional regulator [Microbacterium sp.]|uniref:LacI family DNA-binding transcriptional regulator n=1 Tax=Microbacterium sp. TaxID=51671 RepID=UPI0039E499F9